MRAAFIWRWIIPVKFYSTFPVRTITPTWTLTSLSFRRRPLRPPPDCHWPSLTSVLSLPVAASRPLAPVNLPGYFWVLFLRIECMLLLLSCWLVAVFKRKHLCNLWAESQREESRRCFWVQVADTQRSVWATRSRVKGKWTRPCSAFSVYLLYDSLLQTISSIQTLQTEELKS